MSTNYCNSLLYSVFYRIGDIINFIGASICYGNKKMDKPNPALQKVNAVAHQRIANNFEQGGQQTLRSQFDATILRMGSRLHDFQTAKLNHLFNQALPKPNPREYFERAIDSGVPQTWVESKAAHLKINLLPLLPTHPITTSHASPSPLLLQIQSISQKPINPKGEKLVCFYKTGPTEFLGNFGRCSNGTTIWGKRFACTEAAFQWRKYYLSALSLDTTDPRRLPLLNQINDPVSGFFSCNGEEAFKLNKRLREDFKGVLAPNWDHEERDPAMWQALQAKFQQNPELQQLLAATAGAYLLEHNQASRDSYWSDNHDGSGKNMLGRMLMSIRDHRPCPVPHDDSHQTQIQKYAHFANQPGALNYQIF